MRESTKGWGQWRLAAAQDRSPNAIRGNTVPAGRSMTLSAFAFALDHLISLLASQEKALSGAIEAASDQTQSQHLAELSARRRALRWRLERLVRAGGGVPSTQSPTASALSDRHIAVGGASFALQKVSELDRSLLTQVDAMLKRFKSMPDQAALNTVKSEVLAPSLQACGPKAAKPSQTSALNVEQSKTAITAHATAES
jgi:hypothetical protein